MFQTQKTNIKRIKKILIPNRGEISLRIQRTCRELGILSVAVFSEPDRQALHVRYADEAYPLPGSSSQETYLNQDLLFKIIHQCGADAVHPGYGFLSENGEFAQRCKEEGILFIGPPPEAIYRMGLKTRSRELMKKAGVPIIPGTGVLNSEQEAIEAAEKIGYPILIKASAGGGGKGMRMVDDPSRLLPSYEACKKEGLSSFGNPDVYMEKYLSKPRHIEIQILADSYGNITHLFERECSLQRRHQKIIEETPSPFIDESLRADMVNAAIKAASVCGYVNAGTIEFLVDEFRNFYFLEMNTRLQVEHAITEMLTGLDLVEKQIRIAEGEPLDIKNVSPRGSVVECRIYAEDPMNEFLPSPGLVKSLTLPSGPGIRNDSGIYQGFTIPMEYDPLISKLVTWGEDREKAVNRMIRALQEYHLLGIRSNIQFLLKILKHPGFISGDYDTHFIPTHLSELLEPEPWEVKMESVALATAAILKMMKSENAIPGQQIKQSDQNTPKIPGWKLYGRIYREGSIIK